MQLKLVRVTHEAQLTRGILYELTPSGLVWLSYTMEDRARPQGEKVLGETCIWPGTYPLRLRTWGSWDQRMSEAMPGQHKGMIEICDVPDFSAVLIHPGNTTEDTRGCVLVGNAQTRASVTHSRTAYRRLYPRIANALIRGSGTLEVCTIPGLPNPATL